VLTGEERAAALSHLATCESCQALVAELSFAADSVLLAAPSVEPPPGFESRVLSRLVDHPSARAGRRWPLLAAAAAVIAIVGGGVGYALGSGSPDRTLPIAAALHGSSGRTVGTVTLATGPDRMTCVFEDAVFDGSYSVVVVLADGSIAEVGDFEMPPAPWSWTVELPVDAADVREVRVLDDADVVRSTAELD
jgi:hypothetical protein